MLQFYLGKTKFLPAHVYDTLVDAQGEAQCLLFRSICMRWKNIKPELTMPNT